MDLDEIVFISTNRIFNGPKLNVDSGSKQVPLSDLTAFHGPSTVLRDIKEVFSNQESYRILPTTVTLERWHLMPHTRPLQVLGRKPTVLR